MSLYSTAVKKPISTALIFVAVMVIGLFSLTRLSIDLFPEIETNTIMVLTAYPGASASDIETNVTKIMENTLNTVSDLKEITSDSKENISIITLEFEYGTNIDVATNDVRDKIDQIRSHLPDNVENPVLFKFGMDDIPIVVLSVTAEESMSALYKILDDKVSNPLKRISGVGAVSVSGIPQREIKVYCDPQKLDAYGLSIESISQIIAMENLNTPGGYLDMGSNTFSLRVEGEFSDVSQLNDVVVSSKDGKVIYLRDVARVEDGAEERAQEAYISGINADGSKYMGKKGGTIFIQKQSGSNSVEISQKIIDRLPELQASLPSDVKLGLIVNTSTSIENTIQSLIDTIVVTFLIVLAVVFIFLGRWRATMIIVITIPISLIASFAYLLLSGNTLNIISLSSLSIAIGMVVDDAIVVLENVTNHIERGSEPKQAAIHATNEVAISVVASTLTMLAVFLPLTMIPGMAGILFRQLGWIVSIIMIVSTVAALTLIPMLCSQFLRLDRQQGKLYNMFFSPILAVLSALDRGYAKLLKWALGRRTVVVLIAASLFIGSMGLLKFIPTEFFPVNDNGRIAVNIQLPIGIRTEIARELGIKVDSLFMEKYPEIIATSFTAGMADPDNTFASINDNGTHIISWNIQLSSVGQRERGMTEIVDMMTKDLSTIPELTKYEVIAGGNKGGIGGQSSVDIEVYGFDFDLTDKFAAELTDKLVQIPGIASISNSRGDYIPEFQVDFDREKLALNGLNVATASSHLRNRINGTMSSYYREDGDEYDIKVRYAPEHRETLEDIENIIIYNNLGQGVRIRDLGKVVERLTPPTIERKSRERVITLSAMLGKDAVLGDIAAQVNALLDDIETPPGINTEIAGAFEDQQDMFADLILLGVMIILLVFIVLAAQFESLTDPFIIMFSLPFAFTGVFIGLAVTNTPLGVMAMIGLIMLAGIVVKNGIVLIDYTILNRERGMTIRRAIINAGRSRLRPVLMTTLTTVLGMVPMAIGTGEGSEMWRSMGMSVAWGLSFSTLITLVIVPTVYCIFAKNGLLRHRKNFHKKLKKAKA